MKSGERNNESKGNYYIANNIMVWYRTNICMILIEEFAAKIFVPNFSKQINFVWLKRVVNNFKMKTEPLAFDFCQNEELMVR